ncbi:MAG TPA: excalibur calcium-binding domain-containing protein [Sphingomicrobium sp.]|nr:excalibur calcium-binding domain-containing protein [Sphingomicrobium sp.]
MSAKETLIAAVMFGGIGGYVWSSIPPASFQSPEEREAIEQSMYYSGCNEVRAAGKAPLYAGQPGYRENMDGDGDGIACEPHRSF